MTPETRILKALCPRSYVEDPNYVWPKELTSLDLDTKCSDDGVETKASKASPGKRATCQRLLNFVSAVYV